MFRAFPHALVAFAGEPPSTSQLLSSVPSVVHYAFAFSRRRPHKGYIELIAGFDGDVRDEV